MKVRQTIYLQPFCRCEIFQNKKLGRKRTWGFLETRYQNHRRLGSQDSYSNTGCTKSEKMKTLGPSGQRWAGVQIRILKPGNAGNLKPSTLSVLGL